MSSSDNKAHLIPFDTWEKCRALHENFAGKYSGFKSASKQFDALEKDGLLKDYVATVGAQELEGVEYYAKQFVDFISGYKTFELPFILAAMKHVRNMMLNKGYYPNNDVRRDIINITKQLDESVKNVLAPNCVIVSSQSTKNEVDDDA